jgi:hypothetical protein
MHYLQRINKVVVSMAVGAAVMAFGFPAHLNAITSTTPYQPSAQEATNIIAGTGAPASGALARALANKVPVVGRGEASDTEAAQDDNAEDVAKVEAAPEPKKPAVSEPDAVDIWLEKLALHESNHRERIKVLDVNGKYSYGCLQFQEGTFRTYAIKYGFISRNTPTENVIYNCKLQKKIARLMLEENHYNWQAWYTSVKIKGLGLPPRVAKK